MNLTCYIVDDESFAIDVLKTFIEQTPGLELSGFSTDPKRAIDEVTGPGAPDITFLDIDMPGLSGMELAGMVLHDTKIVFTTSHPEYALAAFEKEAFDYLLKPIRYERFARTVMRLKRELRNNVAPQDTDVYFYIKAEVKGKWIRIIIGEIYYVEAALNYVMIYFASSKQMAYLTMEEITEKLPKDKFVRVHRSFIVRHSRIRTLCQGQLTLDNQASIPLGRTYRDAVLGELNELLLKSKRDKSSG